MDTPLAIFASLAFNNIPASNATKKLSGYALDSRNEENKGDHSWGLSLKVESEEGRVTFEEINYKVPKSHLFQEGAATPVINSVLLALHGVAEQA